MDQNQSVEEYLQAKENYVIRVSKRINIIVSIILSALTILFIIGAVLECVQPDRNIKGMGALWTFGALQPLILIIFITTNIAEKISEHKFYVRKNKKIQK